MTVGEKIKSAAEWMDGILSCLAWNKSVSRIQYMKVVERYFYNKSSLNLRKSTEHGTYAEKRSYQTERSKVELR